MKKAYLLLVLLTALLHSQDFKKTGTSGFTFLGVPASARAAGIAEAAAAHAGMQAASVFTNPAGLGFMGEGNRLFAGYSPWFAEITHLSASYAVTTAYGAFAGGVSMFNYGTINRTVRLGSASYQVLGTYTASAGAYGLTYAKRLTDRFAFGISAKYVREAIDVYSASNIVADAGFIYFTGLGSLRLGAVVQNFGTDATFRNSSFKMPAVFKIGVAADVVSNGFSTVTLLAQADHPSDAPERVAVGAEALLGSYVTVRGGYKFFYDVETFSAGIGIRSPAGVPVQFDFSANGYGVLGTVYRLSLEAEL